MLSKLDKHIKVGRFFPTEPKYKVIEENLPIELENLYRFSNALVEKVNNGELSREDFDRVRKQLDTCSILRSDLTIKLDLLLITTPKSIIEEELKHLKDTGFYQVEPGKEKDEFFCALEIDRKVKQLPQILLADVIKNMPGSDYNDGMDERLDALKELLSDLQKPDTASFRYAEDMYNYWALKTFTTVEFQDFMLKEKNRFYTKYTECVKDKIATIGKRINIHSNEEINQVKKELILKTARSKKSYSHLK